MGYQVTWENRSVRKLKKLSNKVIIDVLTATAKLYEDPENFGKPLSRELKGKFRLRVGDYRLLYTLNKEKNLVTIFDIGHRKDVYE